MKVLLTGFEPFGGETINPSWEVAKRVSSEGVEGAEIVTALLPTVFGKSINEAVRVIEELKPDLVISLGQAGGSAEITVERVAINISDAGCRLQKVYSPSFFHKTEPPFSILEKNLLLLWRLWSASSDIEMGVSGFGRDKKTRHIWLATLINWLFPRYDRAH